MNRTENDAFKAIISLWWMTKIIILLFVSYFEV
ncbi:GntR family transcriptional regulator, partial [Acinetobacter baumannii]